VEDLTSRHPGGRAGRATPAGIAAGVLLALMWLVALSMRAVTIGVAPVLSLIRTDLEISFAEAGLLFALPVVLMGLGAEPGVRLANRLGTERAVFVSVALLAAGSGLRAVAPGYWAMLLFTAIFSAGIGLGQPCLARLVRERFPRQRATATGVYTTGFVCGAILAASATGTLLVWLGPDSWRGTCLVWAALAALALIAWVALGPIARAPRSAPLTTARHAAARAVDSAKPRTAVGRPSVWRDGLAWLITLFFLAQGLIFYQLSGWLPTYYQELGFSLEQAGEPLALMNLTMLPVTLVVAYASDRQSRRRP
jgi:CP family cyanate transporter-like MFS transporter